MYCIDTSFIWYLYVGSGDKLYLVGCLKSPDRKTPKRNPTSPSSATPLSATPPHDFPSSQSQPPPGCILTSPPSQTLHHRGNGNLNSDRDSPPTTAEGACSLAQVSNSPTEGGACPLREEVCPIGEEVCPVGDERRNSNCPFLRYYKLKTCSLVRETFHLELV